MNKSPIVHAFNDQDGTRKLVAHPTKAGAAQLLGISTYLLATHGEVTEVPSEVEAALSAPGAVWARQPGEKSWIAISDSSKSQLLPKQGGKRPGSGQPRLAAKLSRPRSISLDDDTHAQFMALGGTKFLRKTIAASLDLTDQEWEELAKRGGAEWIRMQLSTAAK